MKTNFDNMISTLENTIKTYETTNKLQIEKINFQEKKIQELSSKVLGYDTVIAQNKILEKEIEKMEEILRTKEKTIADFQQLIHESAIKFETYSLTCSKMKEELKNKTDKIAKIKAKVNSLQEENSNLSKENESLKQQIFETESKFGVEITTIKSSFDSVNERYNQIMQKNEILSSQNQENDSLIRTLQSELSKYKSVALDVPSLKKEVINVQRTIKEKDSHIRQLEELNDDLQKKIATDKAIIESLDSSNRKLEEKMKEVTNLCGRYESSYGIVSKELEGKNKCIDDLRKTLDIKEKENKTIKGKLGAKISDLRKDNDLLRSESNEMKCGFNQLRDYVGKIGRNYASNNTFDYCITNSDGEDYDSDKEFHSRTYRADDNSYSKYLINSLKNTLTKVTHDNGI